ncbi:MAG: HPr family phosphocarrier protein [Chloroflexi bacterium HGW-Chloroflexi-10]|nr:MAG: HPr family phosphocarrier protein [Chloroflexi bacterium HGW-Chloroflexi-10]
MQTLTIAIQAAEGLHARPAHLFCSTTAKYKSDLKIRNVTTNSKVVNAKSILLVLTLGVESGHEVEINATGEDEVEAIQALRDLISQDFPGN